MTQRAAPPDFANLLGRYDGRHAPDMVQRNLRILKSVRGGLELVRKHRLAFDPRGEYWRPPERRVLLAYFANKWQGRFAPPEALRRYALHAFHHFDRLREGGTMTFLGVDYDRGGGWPKICDQLIEHARRLAPDEGYARLRAIWNTPETSSEHVLEFFEALRDHGSGVAGIQGGFQKRMPWFSYLGAQNTEDLARRRKFFFGYANLLASSNAYTRGGALAFASLIQNTKSEMVLGTIERWLAGEAPMTTGFPSLDADDEEPESRVHYMVVVEIWGFLHLHLAPLYNSEADGLGPTMADTDPFSFVTKLGERTRAWLGERTDAVRGGARAFREALGAVPAASSIPFESVDSENRARKAGTTVADLADTSLIRELDAAALTQLDGLSDLDAATTWLHLLLDADAYAAERPVELTSQIASAPRRAQDGESAYVAAPAESVFLKLPPALRPCGEQALGYLRAGLHVLFAGAPGTGKTTLAQFVAYAWNRGLSQLPLELALDDAPLTTVANSAWSPFHTIGGLMPDGSGAFVPHAGIFIAPESLRASGWRLRDECIVLDEMNRADLDRCIGELYPLLSGSVQRVHPAGIPGVTTIEAASRFRMIATVNDATLDDIVFPISEGLARRFQRIELPGASANDLFEYLGQKPDDSHGERVRRAIEAVREFFLIAGDEKDLLSRNDEVDRLRFGAGYFALLQAWAQRRLDPPPLLGDDDRKLARRVLAESLASLTRDRRLHGALGKLRAQL